MLWLRHCLCSMSPVWLTSMWFLVFAFHVVISVRESLFLNPKIWSSSPDICELSCFTFFFYFFLLTFDLLSKCQLLGFEYSNFLVASVQPWCIFLFSVRTFLVSYEKTAELFEKRVMHPYSCSSTRFFNPNSPVKHWSPEPYFHTTLLWHQPP